MSRGLIRVLVCAASLAIAATALPGSASSASAYDGTKAATYADSTWYFCEDGHYTYTNYGFLLSPQDPNGRQWRCGAGNGGDCTNWASQVTNAGGYSMENFSTTRRWYYRVGTDGLGFPNHDYDYWTSTWVNAYAWANFLLNIDHDNGSTGPGGGFLYGQGYGNINQKFNSLLKGDMIFFDQANYGDPPFSPGNIGGIDHTRVEVGWNSTMDYADQHGGDQWHNQWNKASDPTVYIYQVHIDAANR